MVGAAIAAAGWRRRTALATPAAIIAANIPDVDIVTVAAGEFASLALRRGWTHGPPAVLGGALVTVGVVLLWDRVRGQRRADAPRADAGTLLVLSLIAAVSHPLLDWMNTYGIRLLMPLDRTWYYGDSLFIIDPWLWLLLGVPLFLIHSRSSRALAAWSAPALIMTAVVLGTGFVPDAAKAVWLLGIVIAVALRYGVRRQEPDVSDVAITGVSLAAIYIAMMVISSNAAAGMVQRVAVANGIAVQDLMIAPRPARPLDSEIVIRTPDTYHFGEFSWVTRPRVRIELRPLPRGELDAAAQAAAQYPPARDFLVWSRYPIVETRSTPDGGYLVRFRDARYVDGPGGGSLGGLTVRLDSALTVLGRTAAGPGTRNTERLD